MTKKRPRLCVAFSREIVVFSPSAGSNTALAELRQAQSTLTIETLVTNHKHLHLAVIEIGWVQAFQQYQNHSAEASCGGHQSHCPR